MALFGGTHDPASAFPLREADQCVLCGMCSAYCPTYLKNREEGESPRGRIAILIALASNSLTPSPRMRAHIAHCLVCRACERSCPSGVPYGRIIDAGRALLAERVGTPLVERLLLHGLIAQPDRLQRLAGLLYKLQRSGLIRLAPLLGLRRLARLLPPLHAPLPFQPHYPARGVERGRVALFTGCITKLLDRTTLEASLHVLTHLGFSVDVPPEQGCCGALHLHAGDPVGAEPLLQQNAATFAKPEWLAILTMASGCGVTLAESLHAQHGDHRVMDISDFLARSPWPKEITVRPLHKRVAVHDPCSLVNGLRKPEGPYQLLRRIPGLMVLPLPENNQCCGGAGAALLTHSDLTEALQSDKIDALREIAPDILVTSNLGCALHLTQGTQQAGISLEIIHPITLLARQLAFES